MLALACAVTAALWTRTWFSDYSIAVAGIWKLGKETSGCTLKMRSDRICTPKVKKRIGDRLIDAICRVLFGLGAGYLLAVSAARPVADRASVAAARLGAVMGRICVGVPHGSTYLS